MKEKEFRRIDMKNGLYALFPNDWEVVGLRPADCEYAGYVKFDGAEQLPIFAFFWDEPIRKMTKEDDKLIFDDICKIWPCFSDYLYYMAHFEVLEDGDFYWEDNDGSAPELGIYDFYDVTDVPLHQIESAIFNSNTPNGEPAIICSDDRTDVEEEFYFLMKKDMIWR